MLKRFLHPLLSAAAVLFMCSGAWAGIHFKNLSASGTFTAGNSITFTADAVATSGETIYYQFDLIPGYGTGTYDPYNTFSTIKSLSTENTCTYTFSEAGGYVLVVKASSGTTLPSGTVPIIGKTLYVASEGEENTVPDLNQLTFDLSGPIKTGTQLTITSGSGSDNDLNYKFHVVPNYGTAQYDPNNNWSEMQAFSKSVSCQHPFDNAGDYIVVVFGSRDETIPSGATPLVGGSVTVNNTESSLQQILDQTVQSSETKGVVLLIDTPAVQWTGASGYANAADQTPIKTSDVLRIASMTKTFTAATLLKLIEEGKLGLDDKISAHLSESIVSRIANGSEITVRQLMAMTSGVKNYTDLDTFNDATEGNPSHTWTPEEVITYVYDVAADFAPGAGWNYSNSNCILMELIVKQVTGSTLAAEMRRLILDPIGLKNAFMEIQEPREGGFGGLLVRGYEDGTDVTEHNDGLGLGDGGLISDAWGLKVFLEKLLKDKTLLNSGSLNSMMTFHETEDYGLCLERRNTDYGVAYGHNGASGGFQGDMIYLPDRQVIFVFMSNTIGTDLFDTLFKKCMSLLYPG